MRIGLTLIVFVLSAGCSQDTQCHLVPRPWQSPSVSVDDLNGKVAVIGRLGKPLGTIVTIRGQLVQPQEKGEDNLFRIESVDGQAITPINMEIVLFPGEKFPTGGEAGWIGYEDGGFEGVPQQAMPNSTSQPLFQTRVGRAFITRFHATKPAPPEQFPSSPNIPPGQFG